MELLYPYIPLTVILTVVFLWVHFRSKKKKKWMTSPESQMIRATGKGRKPTQEILDFDRQFAKTWAQEILEAADRVAILDTETPGISDNDEVLQIAAIDGHGRVLLDTLIKPPTRKRWPKAQAIHGIEPKTVADAPTFDVIFPELKVLLTERIAVFYNAKFDAKLIVQTASRAGLVAPDAKLECAMIQFSLFKGQWDERWQHYKWHKLPSARHSALEDCRATLKLIQEMASD